MLQALRVSMEEQRARQEEVATKVQKESVAETPAPVTTDGEPSHFYLFALFSAEK